MAKDKLLRWTRVYDGSVELSGDARMIDNLALAYDTGNAGGLSHQVRYFLVTNSPEMGVYGFQALVNDTATTGSHAVLNSAPTSTRISVLLGSGAEPAVGDPAYSIPAKQIADMRSFDNGIAAVSADYPVDAAQSVESITSPWGVVINPDASLSSTTDQSSVDNGAGTSAGGHAILHIIANDGGEWTFKVQHSTDDSSWADLITFTADGSGNTSELQTTTGTVNQYIRFQATRTSGTVTPVCVFVRY